MIYETFLKSKIVFIEKYTFKHFRNQIRSRNDRSLKVSEEGMSKSFHRELKKDTREGDRTLDH